MSNVREVDFGAPVASLIWAGDALVDVVGGWRALLADGSIRQRNVSWGFPFDRVVAAPSGRFHVLYAETGTKAAVVSGSKIIRELNRSYYHATAYEYPISVFALPDGREIVAHCPEHYNRLELELLATGERLTERTSDSPDVFHSRLRPSPDGRRLLSAGWVWHPWGVAILLDVESSLTRPEALDEHRPLENFDVNGEVESVCWLDSDRVVISLTPEEGLGDPTDGELLPGQLGVWSASDGCWLTRCTPTSRVGTLHRFGDHVLGLHGYPKVVDPANGHILAEWPDIATGTQESSIVWAKRAPSIAVDSDHMRFAVAAEGTIVIVECETGELATVAPA